MNKKLPLLISGILSTVLGFAQYCSPTIDNNDENIGIAKVVIGNFSNSSMSAPGYTDYSGTSSFSAYEGQEMNITIQNGAMSMLDIMAWVDWNQNNIFDYDEIISNLTEIGKNKTATFKLIIPTTQAVGNYRLRIGSVSYDNYLSSCNSTDGEFEDYSFDVLPNINMEVDLNEQTHPSKLQNSISKQISNLDILKFDISTKGTISPLILNSISFDLNGTTDIQDISNFKLYYGGTNPNFANASLIAQSTQINTLNFSPFTFEAGPNHYFWLAIDLNPNATEGNKVDVSVNEVAFDSQAPYSLLSSAPSGDYTIVNSPFAPGNGNWNVYAFNGTNFNPSSLAGYYTDNTGLNFSSEDKWSSYSSPSAADTYSGNPVNQDYHSVMAVRTNFNFGLYELNIPNHDDDVFLDIDNQNVFKHIGCCDSHYSVWTGELNANSVVNFRWTDFSGGSHGGLTINPVTPYVDYIYTTPQSPILNGQKVQIYGDYFVNVSKVKIGGEFVSFTVIDKQHIEAIMGCGVANDSLIVYTPYGNAEYEGIHLTTDFYEDNDGDGFGNPAVSINQCAPSVAGYVTNKLDCDDTDPANTPTTWYFDNDGDGYGIMWDTILACTQPTGYASLGGDCRDNDPTVNPSTSCNFPKNVWNAYCYENDDYTNYKGYYTHNGISFNTTDKWNPINTPSDAPNYSGAPVPADYHSISYMRKGFPKGLYQINVLDVSNSAELLVNDQYAWSYNAASNNVWSGLLDSNSTVEFDWNDNGGASLANVEFIQAYPHIDNLDNTMSGEGDINYIYGYNFYDVDSVLVGGVKVPNFTVQDDETIEIELGCHPTGNVVVYTKYGNSNGVLLNSINGVRYYLDNDGDGFGTDNNSFVSCTGGATGYVTQGGDCDDTNPTVNPDVVWYLDKDGDGFGMQKDSVLNVTNVSASSSYNSDNDAAYAFDKDTVYNGWGSDGHELPATLQFDLSDGSQIVNNYKMYFSCDQNGGWCSDEYTPTSWDFQAFDGTKWVTLDSRSNQSLDIDEWFTFAFSNTTAYQTYRFNFTNSFQSLYARVTEIRIGQSSIKSCIAPNGYVNNNADCNDADANVVPDSWYSDKDNDSYGDPNSKTYACTQPVGYVANASDCDDNDDKAYTSVLAYTDLDGDGYDNGKKTICYDGTNLPIGYSLNTSGTDCNDNDQNITGGSASAVFTINSSSAPTYTFNGPADMTSYTWYIDGVVVANTQDFNKTFTQQGNYTVSLKTVGTCGVEDSTAQTVGVVLTGIDGNTALANFSLAPNPTNEFVTLSGVNVGNASVQIFSLNGQMVYNYNTNFDVAKSKTINVSEFANGVYFVKVITSNQTLIQKLVVKH